MGLRTYFLYDATFTPFVRPNPPGHSSQQFAMQLQFFVNDLSSFVERIRPRGDIEIWNIVDIRPLRMKHFFIRELEENLFQSIEPY